MDAVQGALWEGVLPGVLRGLYVGRRTGVLSFVRGDERCGVRFRLGNILSADTTVRENRLGETLVRQGRLTPGDLKRAVGFALRDGKRLGAVLMDLGLVDAPGLEEAVTAQAHQVLLHVFSWSEGSYEFHEESADQLLDGDVPPALYGELILQAARAFRIGRRSLQPRRHRPDPVALGRPAASLPAHQPEPRRRLRALARGRHAERT
jgi:hypothetical protein